jgi:hypothetical protein
MNTKFTPGPWSLRISTKYYENRFQIQRSDGICLFSFGDSPFHEDAEADARLIAAAPLLLSSNNRLLNDFRLLLAGKPVRGADETIAAAEHAIAAATGDNS